MAVVLACQIASSLRARVGGVISVSRRAADVRGQ
jgi:hypothetical protein